MNDPYGTDELRRRVLDAWAASPARFREDANAEDDYALGGYRDRVVVELAQNAADAAIRAGEPGRLRLDFDGAELTAANTGAPLDTAGVESLSTLRASAKRDDTQTGRFGVGFAAVVAVSDAPVIASTTGAVRWSRDDTRGAATAIPALAAELAARDRHVPILRLPFPAEERPPADVSTVVRLPLRDTAARDLVRDLLAAVGPALLLALPALSHVEIHTPDGTRTLTAQQDGDTVWIDTDGTASRWRITDSAGPLDDHLLADRPAEERTRTTWSVRWAIPVDPAGAPVPPPPDVPHVVHAPTPSDEPQTLPALLLASFPLAPDRRHVAPGPLTDHLIDRAADDYAHALCALPGDPALLDLVPVGMAGGELDAALRRAIIERLPDTPFLAGAEPDSRIRPRDAVSVSAGDQLITLLTSVLSGLLPAVRPTRHAALRALEVRILGPADLADLLVELRRAPAWWHDLYTALEGADPEALGALPVPLADDRLVRGPRGLLLPADELRAVLAEPEPLAPLGLRVVHPDAAHPLLRRLGAVDATPRGVLDDPATRAAVSASFDADDPDPTAEAVLTLVAAAHLAPGDAPWLADLALPGADGDHYPAGELLVPDAPLAEVLAEDAPFGTVAGELVDRFGAETLQAVGVLRTFALLHAEDVPLDALDTQLDAEQDWADALLDRAGDGPVPPVVPELVAVRDLEFVDPDRWDRALELLAEPPLRACVTDPVRVLLGDGRTADLPSYTGWWLARHPVLNGHRPGELRMPDADPLLAGLYPPCGPTLDPRLARALGVHSTLAALLDAPGGAEALLVRLADPDLPVGREQLHGLWTALSDVDPSAVSPPDRIRAVRGDTVVVADADDTVVVDTPDALALLGDCALVLTGWDRAGRLADLLDLPLASEEVTGSVDGSGTPRPVPDPVRLSDGPADYVAHDRLTVGGTPVPWRWADGVLHAATPDGLARGVAWAAGRWADRHLLAALLRHPEAAPILRAEADLDR